ncbi:MAG: hypothetical protein V7L23_07165 [Nostoc sp.]
MSGDGGSLEKRWKESEDFRVDNLVGIHPSYRGISERVSPFVF